jgi:lipopolysaccharide biosynthesis glycosyltransferase
VVLKDITELYDQELGHFPLGAVADVMAKEILRIYFYPGLSNYFNSGVLLINLDYWRQENIKKKAWDFMRRYRKDIIRPDQDILNCLFNNNWKVLDNRFNVDLKRKSFMVMPGSDTVVLHYSDRIKPWQYLFTRSSSYYYFVYLKKTPWGDFKFKDKNLKNFFKKYYLLSMKELKRILLPFVPLSLLDNYRRLLWRTYEMKK